MLLAKHLSAYDPQALDAIQMVLEDSKQMVRDSSYYTFPETNNSHLKIDVWKSTRFVEFGCFQVPTLVCWGVTSGENIWTQKS